MKVLFVKLFSFATRVGSVKKKNRSVIECFNLEVDVDKHNFFIKQKKKKEDWWACLSQVN